MFVFFILVSLCGTVYAEDAVKISLKKEQDAKIWKNKNGVQRIYPIYLVAKVAGLKAAVASETKKKENVAKPRKTEESDSVATVVEEMDHAACRESLAEAEDMASVQQSGC